MLTIKRHVQSLLEKGAYTKAIGAAADFSRRNPTSAASLQLVAFAEESAGFTKAAIQTISRAIKLAPGDSSIRIMRARLYLKDNRFKEAIADVNTIIAMSDSQHEAHFLENAIACRNELLDRMSSAQQPRTSQEQLRFGMRTSPASV